MWLKSLAFAGLFPFWPARSASKMKPLQRLGVRAFARAGWRLSVARLIMPAAMMNGRKKNIGIVLIPRRFCRDNRMQSGRVPAARRDVNNRE
jgi:hypothetical protein